MNSAERVGLKSICFESPGSHGTLSCICPGQTPLLGRGRGLLLSSPHEPHASSEYLAFCKASMSSVPSFLLNGNKTLPGRGRSASQDPLLWPRVPGPGSSRLKPVPHLPFLHPEKMSHSFTHHQPPFKSHLTLKFLSIYEEPVILPH